LANHPGVNAVPKFQDQATWEQAEQVMQPALIRVIANVGKRLEQTPDWQGTYEDVQVWESGVAEAIKTQVMDLRSLLESATAATVDQIRQELAQLPAPYPGYQLRLSQGEQVVTVELWDLCYQICFRNYDSVTGTSWTRGFGQGKSQGVEIDPDLFKDNGDVDWVVLDGKAQQVVERVFANLP
jgi:hypothetical protein